MKKLIYLIIIVLISSLVLTGCLLSNVGQVPATEQTKVKPTENLAGSVKVPWNLSGAVMPVPPYGSMDIPGSDTASKLIVNQPNGNTEVTITGVMNGLTPDTTYTVYLSNGYTPYLDTGWDVAGNYNIAITYSGTDYIHLTNLTQSGTSITGGQLVYPGNTKSVTSGSVVDNTIHIVAEYTENGPGIVTLDGTIAADGSMTGTWLDTWGELNRTGDWRTTGGLAEKTHTGSTGWPGLFNPTTVPAFTFTTDAYGSGSWHVNLKDSDFSGPGTYTLSVWINQGLPYEGPTILISDTFGVTR